MIELTARIEAADHAARHWRFADPRPLRVGTDLHRKAACRMFHETFNPYKPSVIDWPRLDRAALERLTSLPIWDIAVQTEGKARLRMQRYAASLPDADWREALELNGWEEGRHKEVLANLVQAYGIALAPEPVYAEPRDPEWAYLVTGFSECIDSFFAFGLFETGATVGIFPTGARRYVRAGDPGRGAAHPAVCELARMASAAPAVLATRAGLSCGSPRSGCSWPGSASGSRAAWMAATASQRTTTSR